ncbi:serine hydrolase domain-containing protein [Pontibacter cellulosilyticus]|uniref:Serine hydrolase n=1 Tax=Pontibacter cellulosilyticus TaxID=1720253 RepID=A0A923N4B0_9BACT|nr:serine hydrolase [Pontibacter cellulosilyticus]MBC5991467.1 serine hydrolase [Pontibacter cellulosilyticus]
MKQLFTIKLYLLALLSVLISSVAHGQEVTKKQTPNTIEELRIAILQVLEETGAPAAGIALVDKRGPVWVEGLGMADREKAIPANEETMFRIGSSSKIFVALAILKLQEQGKLSLKDKVRDLVPEIEFTNPWEATNPILVEHLLEHTTGWDDIHLPEITHNDPGTTLKEGLDFHPHSRTSKWVPGTRMAYANSGPAVAAYIVEKVSGQTYEDYIRKNFFAPMGAETMTYFLSEDYKQKGATLYKEGRPNDYWHLITRPSGAINASPKDMAKMLQLFINRGKANGNQLVSESSLERMKSPSTTSGAKAGLKYGYGLGLYTSDYNGYTYYKHGGSVGAGKSDFSYLPEYGIGYSVQTNSDNTAAIRKIGTLIREYQTSQLPRPVAAVPTISKSGVIIKPVTGYYEQVNPVKQLPFKLPSLLPERIWSERDTIYNQFPAHFGQIVKFVPVGEGLYHNLETGRPDFIVVHDPLEGEVLELAGVESGTVTLAPVNGTIVFGRIAMFILWALFILQAFLSLPFWLYRFWKGKIPGGANVLVRIWPLIPVGFIMVAAVFLAFGAMEGKIYLADPSFISVSVMLATIAFFAAAVFAVVMAIRYRNKGIKKAVYIPATFLSVLHLLVALYFLWYGVIGLRTWA